MRLTRGRKPGLSALAGRVDLAFPAAAALGHCHREGQPTGHGFRPHFHTNPAPTSSDHGHHHGPGGHHHQHEDDEVPPAEPDRLPTKPPQPLSDHDSDAVYIAAVDAVVVERSQVEEEGVSPTWWTAAESMLFAAWDCPPAQLVICGYPPPLAGSLCPLSVRHLALLI